VAEPELALSIAFRAAGAALAIGFLEQLTVYDRAFGDYGPFSTSVAQVLSGSDRPLVAGNSLLVILCLGATAGIIAAALGPFGLFGTLGGVITFMCVIFLKRRRVSASDGAEQMALLVIFATSVATLPGVDRQSLVLAVSFIGAQAVLSYATAGIAKAISPTWRAGNALALIMGSESHGHSEMSRLLQGYPHVARLLTRGVVAFECAFPLVFVGPAELTTTILAVGFLFHTGCAVTMGLNTFLLVFPGTYACIAYIAQRASPLW
jgi:hypothetical protein